MSPGDLVPEAIRQVAIRLNITNAGILHDKNYVLNHKYKSLLLNVPTRHVINEMESNPDKVKLQLSRLRDLDVVNYFLLGESSSVKMILNAGESLGFSGRKYGWFVFSLDDETWPMCDCQNMTVLFFKPQPPSTGNRSDAEFVRSMLPKPLLSSSFYYDMTMLAVTTMKSALDSGEWPMEPYHIDCDSFNGTNRPIRDFDFLAKLMMTSKDMTPTYAGVTWGKKNGEHRTNFLMTMYMANVEHGRIAAKIETGTWRAGIDSLLQASVKKYME